MSTEKSKIKKFYFVVKAMALKSIMCYNKSDDISYDGAVIRLTDKAAFTVIIVRRKYIRHYPGNALDLFAGASVV